MIALGTRVVVPVEIDGKLVRRRGRVMGRSRGAGKYDIRLDSGDILPNFDGDRIEVEIATPSNGPRNGLTVIDGGAS
jgi:hypothetical protein